MCWARVTLLLVKSLIGEMLAHIKFLMSKRFVIPTHIRHKYALLVQCHEVQVGNTIEFVKQAREDARNHRHNILIKLLYHFVKIRIILEIIDQQHTLIAFWK